MNVVALQPAAAVKAADAHRARVSRALLAYCKAASVSLRSLARAARISYRMMILLRCRERDLSWRTAKRFEAVTSGALNADELMVGSRLA